MYINGIIYIILLHSFLTIHYVNGFGKSKVDQALEKAKKYFKNEFGGNNTWHFLGYDLSEYPAPIGCSIGNDCQTKINRPRDLGNRFFEREKIAKYRSGANEQYREMNRKKWNAYYDCLKLQDKNLGTKNTVTPEALVAYQGSSVKFECKICLSPFEISKVDSVVWEWAGVKDEHLSPLEMDEHILEAPDDKTLHIYSLGVEQTGRYKCKLGNSLTESYFLTVIATDKENAKMVRPATSPTGPYSFGEKILSEYNLVLFIEWGPWSPCTRCDKVGKKRRFGYCVVSLKTETEKEDTLNVTEKQLETGTTTEIHKLNPRQIMKRSTEEQVLNITLEYELLNIFEYGIPTKSHVLPKQLKRIPEIGKCRNEMMIAYCKVECTEAEMFIVKDKLGNVIERANNSAGIYSMHQGFPPVEPSPIRTVMYSDQGKYVILACPGGLNSEAQITWKIGWQNVVPPILTEQTNGRLYVSVTDKLHIMKAKIEDSNLYSCWQNNELIATIRLVVEKKINLDFNHHIMLAGMVAIMGTFVFVFLRAYLGRKRAKTIG